MRTIKHKKHEYIELASKWAVIELPENAVSATIDVDVYIDGKITKVMQSMNMNDIGEAFRKAAEGYIDEDDRFCLTEKGKALAKELELCN